MSTILLMGFASRRTSFDPSKTISPKLFSTTIFTSPSFCSEASRVNLEYNHLINSLSLRYTLTIFRNYVGRIERFQRVFSQILGKSLLYNVTETSTDQIKSPWNATAANINLEVGRNEKECWKRISTLILSNATSPSTTNFLLSSFPV